MIKLFALLLALCAALQNPDSYSNNFYVLLSSSKFYFNYRHTVNVLVVYQYLKEMGITDD